MVRKNLTFMQTQDAPTEFLIRFWPWFETNRKRLLGVVMAAIAVFVIWYFISTQRAQKAVDAGQAYTQLELTLPPTETVQQVADAFLKIASDYPGTLSAQRAQLQAATLLFGAGRYEDAQAIYQQFLGANSGSPLAAAAQFGVAASLEAENKLDLAAAEYRTVTASYPNSPEALSAQFSLGRTLEAQGKLTEATGYYQGVMRAPLAGSLASEAERRLSQIQNQLAVKPSTKS